MLYAGDAVLRTRTPKGLQTLLDAFNGFMTKRDLAMNNTKSYMMQVGSSSKRKYIFAVNGTRVPTCSTFSYLGVLLDHRLNWVALLNKKRREFTRENAALFGFANKMGSRPVAALLKIY